MGKELELFQLARQRKKDRLAGHKCFGDFWHGAYDIGDYVVPWSKSAHNYDAEVMVMGQDWNSEVNLSGPFDSDQEKYGQKPNLDTNINLKSSS
jgi:hypothetical protein